MTKEKIGEILSKKDNPDEPVMDCVAEKDDEVRRIGVERLRSLVERIERLEEGKKDYAADIADVFVEAKSMGFNCKVIKNIIKLRKLEADSLAEFDFFMDTYRKALDL